MNRSTLAAPAATLPAPSHLATDSLEFYVEASPTYGTVSLRIGPPDTVPQGLRAFFDLPPATARALASLLVAHATALEVTP